MMHYTYYTVKGVILQKKSRGVEMLILEMLKSNNLILTVQSHALVNSL